MSGVEQQMLTFLQQVLQPMLENRHLTQPSLIPNPSASCMAMHFDQSCKRKGTELSAKQTHTSSCSQQSATVQCCTSLLLIKEWPDKHQGAEQFQKQRLRLVHLAGMVQHFVRQEDSHKLVRCRQ